MLRIAVFAAALALGAAPVFAQSETASHIHIGHVMKSWSQTPDGAGLLAAAMADAETARAHAGYALGDPEDLAAMKMHAGHVLQAVAPEGAVQVGSGFGVARAAQGVATHIGLAAKAEGASDNVKLHAAHVASCAQNTLARVAAIRERVAQIEAADSAAAARPYAEQMLALTQALIDGVDANGDGNIGWQEGEGGLAVAKLHMGLMMAGEGISED